jgi:hypothetical protein
MSDLNNYYVLGQKEIQPILLESVDCMKAYLQSETKMKLGEPKQQTEKHF